MSNCYDDEKYEDEECEEKVVMPGDNETQDEFISRCMKIESKKKPRDQAVAICYSKWANRKQIDWLSFLKADL